LCIFHNVVFLGRFIENGHPGQEFAVPKGAFERVIPIIFHFDRDVRHALQRQHCLCAQGADEKPRTRCVLDPVPAKRPMTKRYNTYDFGEDLTSCMADQGRVRGALRNGMKDGQVFRDEALW
jgi:hypothetical protein